MALNITFYDGIRYHRADFMNRDKDFFGNGVVNVTDFPSSFPGGMQIGFGAGTAWVDGYRINNDSSSTVTLTVPVSDLTNPRIDIVQIGHDDVNGVASLVIKEGVAAASPVEPSADPNYFKLYAISVPANATSISSSSITDRRALVPLNVNGSQISLNGAANPNQTNNFTVSQEFTAATSSILATQIVLGQTNNVNAPARTIYLASSASTGIGFDVNGNILPISPSSLGTGANWNMTDKNGATIFQAYLDGSKQILTSHNTLDDGNGNITYKGNIYNSLGYYSDNGAFSIHAPSGRPNTDTWGVIDTNGSSVLLVNTGGSKKVQTANQTLDDGSGNMTIAGNFTSNGTGVSVFNSELYVTSAQSGSGALDSKPLTLRGWSGTAAVGAHLKGWHQGGWFSSNFADNLVTFLVSDTGNVSTVKNTLDDASGNMTVAGTVTAGKGLASTILIGGQNGANPYIQANYNGTTNSQFVWQIDSGSMYADVKGSFVIRNAPNSGSPIFTVSNAGAVSSKNNTLDDGTGKTTLNGIMTMNGDINQNVSGTAVSGTNYQSYINWQIASWWNGTAATTRKRYSYASSNGEHVFGYVNESGTQTDRQMVLDASGNLTVAGTLTLDNDIIGNTSGNFHLRAPSGHFIGFTNNAGNAYGLYAGDGASPAAYTFKNTLDDGSGDMIIAGKLTLTMPNAGIEVGSTTASNTPYIDFHSSGANNDYDARIIASGGSTTANAAGTLSLYGGSIQTVKNILDDGAGNMTVGGSLTSTGDIFAKGNFHFTGTADVNIIPPAGKNIGFTNNADSGWLLRANESTHALYSWNNTLDDGGGNMTATGVITTKNTPTNTPAIQNGDNGGDSFLDGWLNMNLKNTFGSWNVWTQDKATTPAWHQAFTVYGYGSSTPNKVTTLNTTLDDGNGNMTVGGLTANGTFYANSAASFSGNTNLMPKGTASSSSNFASNLLAFGSSTWNGTSAVTNWRNLWMDSTNKVILSNISGTNSFTVDNGGNGWFGGSLTSKNNTLDDGSGNMSVVGSITATSGTINSNGSGDTMFQVKGKGAVGSFPGWNANMLYINTYSNGGTETASFSGGVKIKGGIYGDRNIFDDGSGNMTIAGNLYMPNTSTAANATKKTQLLPNSGVSIQGVSANLLGIADAGAAWQFAMDTSGNLGLNGNLAAGGYVKGDAFISNTQYLNMVPTAGGQIGFTNNARNSWGLYVIDSTNPSAFTLKNQLDDGSGNMSTAGSITTSGGLIVNNYVWMKPDGTATSTTNYSSQVIEFQNSTWNGTSAVTNARRFILDTDNQIKLTNVGNSSYVFSVDSNGKGTFSGGLVSEKNTLDDGSGNMTIAGTINADGGITNPNGNLAFTAVSGKLFSFVTTGLSDGITINGGTVQNPYGTGNVSLSAGSSQGYAAVTSPTGNVYLQAGNASGGVYAVKPGTTSTYVNFYCAAVNPSSWEEYKTNIVPWDIAAIDILKNTVVYEYNLKSELEDGIIKKRHGLVIGEGRETPEEVIDHNGKAIDLYGYATLTTKATQELIERDERKEARIKELEEKDKQKDERIKELEEKLSAVMLKLGA